MDPELKAALDNIMGTWALNTKSASHGSDRGKLRSLFIQWHDKGVDLSVADWEQYLIGLGWEETQRREVLELPEDVTLVARHYGH